MDTIVDALNRLAGVLAGQVQVTMLEGGTGRNVYQSFQSSITGTNTATVWTPQTGRRYVLRGFAITAVVRTVLASASAHALYFQDSGTGTPTVAPIGAYGATDAIGTILTGSSGPFVCQLHEGVRGSAVDTVLRVAAGNDIGSGVIRFTGVVWGVEEST